MSDGGYDVGTAWLANVTNEGTLNASAQDVTTASARNLFGTKPQNLLVLGAVAFFLWYALGRR